MSNRLTWERRCVWALALGAVVALASIAWAQYAIGTSAPWVYDVVTAPQRPVGLVLGCSEKLPGGRQNLYFTYRIQRAAELYRQGKVGHLLVSGDNSRKDYDEPTAMRDALVALGVPGDRVVLDYAGFSTLDSVVRAREVFGQNQLLIVSQKDHVMRAIYIARAKGMDAVGVSAEDVRFGVGLRTDCREALARVRTLLDVWVWGRTPKFLGPRVEIPVRG